jgi:hypothetical protein
MSTLIPRLDILPPAQQLLWPDLGVTGILGYVLYGGTAIALRLGHRASVDFDFFTDLPLDKTALKRACPFITGATILQDMADTLTVETTPSSTLLTPPPPLPGQPSLSGSVKISFFGNIRFGRIGTPDIVSTGLQVASLDDLLATKLKALLQRVEAKDYRDIAALLSAGVALDRGLAGASLLYGAAFQPSECLKALVYFQGGDLDTLTPDVKRTLIVASSSVQAIPQVALASSSLAYHPGTP